VDCAWNDDNDNDDKQQQQNNGMITGRQREQGKPNKKKGPRDIDNVSWATGIVFIVFSRFIFTLLTNVLGTSLNYWQ
jgi:hypothetical protein